MTTAYPVTSRNRLRRRHERGHYDRETVHAILDAAMICHIAYVIDGQPFCTPTSFSVNYRCVMAYGQAQAVTDPQVKLRVMDAFIDRFYPGRAAALRPPTVQEIKAITILEMEIEDAAAKIRATGVSDEEEDYTLPVWCAVLPLRTVLGEPEQCPRQLPGVMPDDSGMAGFVPGRRFDEVMLESYRTAYPATNSPRAVPR